LKDRQNWGFHDGEDSSRDEDADSKVLRNVGIVPQHYTVSQPRRQLL